MSLRKNPKHRRLIQFKWFRVFYSGTYAKWEIDFGRAGHGEFVILLCCETGADFKKINWCYNKPQV